MTLVEEFGRIKNNHKKAVKIRVAKVCFSGSTGRVFKGESSSGNKEKLRDFKGHLLHEREPSSGIPGPEPLAWFDFAHHRSLPPSLSFFAKATKEPATEGRQGVDKMI